MIIQNLLFIVAKPKTVFVDKAEVKAGYLEAIMKDMSKPKTVVLVHGGFVDGSGWQGVYHLLKKDGFDVIVAQNPTISFADDVAVTKRAIAGAEGDVFLVGHSYGGAVVSQAGNDPKVKALVYITAFAPDKGESSRR
jgi:pimeloyl-ACP methyl ester carboxylesterase